MLGVSGEHPEQHWEVDGRKQLRFQAQRRRRQTAGAREGQRGQGCPGQQATLTVPTPRPPLQVMDSAVLNLSSLGLDLRQEPGPVKS